MSSAAMQAVSIPCPRSPHPDPRVEKLLSEIDECEAKLGLVEPLYAAENVSKDADADAIVQRHINLLHTYNEIKDGAQALIGKYALLTHTTVTAAHQELGLSLKE